MSEPATIVVPPGLAATHVPSTKAIARPKVAFHRRAPSSPQHEISSLDPTTATLSAPFVELGNSATSGAAAVVPTPFGGNGNLTVSAQQMVLQGNFALQGTSEVTLSSAGDNKPVAMVSSAFAML